MLCIENLPLFTYCLFLSLLLSLLYDMLVQKILNKNTPFTGYVSMAVTGVFLILYGFTSFALRSILICQLLIVIGLFDFVTHEIPNCLHLFIVLVSLINFQIWSALFGLFLVPLPFLIAALKTGKIGGGDVKLMAASGFAIGVIGGVWMMIWGLLLALLWNFTFCRKNQSVPLAPFLGIGCFLVLIS